MKLKQILSLFLIIVTLFSVCSMPTSAAKILRYDSLDAIEENLDVFKTISKGSISVVSYKKNWYYQFSRKGYNTVQIKVSAFSTQPKNKYLANDNAALTKNCNDNYSRVCYYNTMSTREMSQGKTTYNRYTTNMYRFSLETQGMTHDEVTLKCKLTHGVRFEYHEKVPATVQRMYAGKPLAPGELYYGKIPAPGELVEPANAQEYLLALKRSSDVDPIVPTASLSVKNTGTNNVCLSTYTLCGVGDSSTKLNVNSLISVASATKSAIIAASAKNPVGSFVALTKLIGGAKTVLTKESNQYNTGESTALTKYGQNPVLEIIYKSPITLASTGDWFQVTTNLNKSKFSSKTNATFKIAFSFSHPEK